MKILFLGSADFGIPSLQSLIAAGHDIVGVVSTPAKPKGRGLKLADSAVTEFAHANGLSPVITPDSLKSPDLPVRLAALQADLFVVIAFRILPPELFAIPPLGTVNVHASLLPRYRGPAPIHRAIENGETTTGVTIFRIDAGIDTGGVLLQKSLAIGPQETTPQLYERLMHLGGEALSETVARLAAGNVVPAVQTNEQACKAPKLGKGEGHIDWNQPADTIFNKIRAFKPFPGTHAFLEGKRLNIEWALPQPAEGGVFEPGEITSIDKEGFTVQCRESRLKVLEVKPDGRGAMTAGAFLRGARLDRHQRLG